MAGSSRGAFASTSSWTNRITCHSRVTPTTSPLRVSPRQGRLLYDSASSSTSRKVYSQHPRSFHNGPTPQESSNELSAQDHKEDPEVTPTQPSPINEALSGALYRPAEAVTLEELRKLKPEPESIRIAYHFAPHVRHKLRNERLWQMAYRSVDKTYNKKQLLALAQQANISLPTKSNSRKPQLVSLLIQQEFGFKDPEERPAPLPTPYSKTIPVSTTALFLMLIDGSKVLSQISRQYGVDIRPDMRNKEGKGGPRDFTFVLRATGKESIVEKQVTDAVHEFVQSIQSELYPLVIPANALDGSIIRFISQHVGCSIHQESRSTSSPTLRLAATDTKSITKAKTMLSAMQARYFQSTPALFSFAVPSPLDADYVEDPNGDLTLYGFLPAIPHSAVVNSLKAALGDRLSATLFRLVRSRKAAWTPQPRSSALQNLSLIDMNDPEEPLDSSRNSLRLDERLRPTAAPLENLPLQASLQNVTSTHSLHIGNLLFPGRLSENDSASSLILQHIFGAPLSGSWPLDTAYEWFRQRQPLAEHQAQPVWSPLHLNASATDAISEHAPAMKMWMKQGKGQEEEKIRLVYWAAPSSGEIAPDKVVKLEIDLREVAEVSPSPELEAEQVKSEQVQELKSQQEHELKSQQEQEAKQDLEQELDEVQSASSEQSNEVDDIFGEQEPNASPKEPSSLDDLLGETSITSDPSSADVDTKRHFNYVVDSARWTVSRRADLCAPDHTIDFRAETNTSVPVNLEAVQGLQSLKDYCRSLDELASAPSAQQSPEEQQQHQAHPKTSRHPPPVNSIPPLSFDLGGMTCRFESAERVFSTRWEMDPVAGQEMDKDMYGDPDEEVEDDVNTNNSDNSNTEASSATTPPERVFFINETTIGVEFGHEGSQTSSRIEWVGNGEKEQGEEMGLWKRRMDSVRGLFRSSLIGGLKGSS